MGTLYLLFITLVSNILWLSIGLGGIYEPTAHMHFLGLLLLRFIGHNLEKSNNDSLYVRWDV